MNQGEKQIYGTQFFRDKKTGKMIPRPIMDKKNVNKKRKKIGIKTTLEENLKEMNKQLK